ncbi:MAG: STAS domain-containing protein [Actinomycetota bacterium]|nr:STAS domain-containing protein [Actinomycetota bacterium]
MSLESDIFSTATLPDGTHVIEVVGEIDSSSAPALQRVLIAALSEGHERVVLDLSTVSFMDSSGVGAVMAGYAEARIRDARLAVACGESHAAQRLRMMGLDAVLDVSDDRDQALARVRSG